MTLDQSALLELSEALRAADGGDVMRLMLGAMLQALVDAEATAHIGAGPHERTAARTTQRNGTRDKVVATTAGDLTVRIPKTRTGSFFPTLLAPRRRIDVALHTVIMEAYVHGVSTRKVDDVVEALGVSSGISKSEVSRICARLDADIAAWATRPLDHIEFPYVFLDATYCKARVGGRVVSQAVVIATGVSAAGRREVLGSAVGDSETEDLWTDFLRGLRERGLAGVQLVVSDHHRGLMNAIEAVLLGATWQRCRVHFMRNVLAKVTKGNAEMVAAAIRTIFAQPTGPLVREQVETVATMLEAQLPAIAAMLRDAREEITAFADFPEAHWRKIWSTNPLERINREVKRRTEVVGIFPNAAALHRLSACVLIEAHDEWWWGQMFPDLADRGRAFDWADDTGVIDFEAWLRRDPIDLTDGTQLVAATAQEQAEAAARIAALEEGALKAQGAAAAYQTSVYGPTERIVILADGTPQYVDGFTSAYGLIPGDAKLVTTPASSFYIPETLTHGLDVVAQDKMDDILRTLVDASDAVGGNGVVEIVTNNAQSAAVWEARMQALDITGYVRLQP